MAGSSPKATKPFEEPAMQNSSIHTERVGAILTASHAHLQRLRESIAGVSDRLEVSERLLSESVTALRNAWRRLETRADRGQSDPVALTVGGGLGADRGGVRRENY
jgi:hypothetical protein